MSKSIFIMLSLFVVNEISELVNFKMYLFTLFTLVDTRVVSVLMVVAVHNI